MTEYIKSENRAVITLDHVWSLDEYREYISALIHLLQVRSPEIVPSVDKEYLVLSLLEAMMNIKCPEQVGTLSTASKSRF